MRVTATQYEESVVCTLPEGKQIEIIMVSVKGEDHCARPNLDEAPNILAQLGKSGVFDLDHQLVEAS